MSGKSKESGQSRAVSLSNKIQKDFAAALLAAGVFVVLAMVLGHINFVESAVQGFVMVFISFRLRRFLFSGKF